MSQPLALGLGRRIPGRIRPQLDALQRALAMLGDPQQQLRSVLIVGTNGKGSTAAMVDQLLRTHGRSTGLFTSPHLVRVEERIRIDGLPVKGTVLQRRLADLEAHADLTYFETLTAAAFLIFAETGVDVAVLEAGMGGSWDATRLAHSEIAGLTNVGTDHRSWLGASRRDIARDKGSALAAARRAVYGPGCEPEVVREVALPHVAAAASLVGVEIIDPQWLRVRWDGAEVEVPAPLAGAHQVDNVHLAVALARVAAEEGWIAGLKPTAVQSALGDVHWPGRLSLHRVFGREVLVDCAHNLEAVQALTRHLDGAGTHYNLLFSCLDDKPLEDMAALLRPRVATTAVCPLDDERSVPVEQLAAAFPGAAVADDAIAALNGLADPVLVTGSIRLVGEILAHEDPENVREQIDNS